LQDGKFISLILYLDTFLVASILAAFIVGAEIGHEQQLLSAIFTLAVTVIAIFASKNVTTKETKLLAKLIPQ